MLAEYTFRWPYLNSSSLFHHGVMKAIFSIRVTQGVKKGYIRSAPLPDNDRNTKMQRGTRTNFSLEVLSLFVVLQKSFQKTTKKNKKRNIEISHLFIWSSTENELKQFKIYLGKRFFKAFIYNLEKWPNVL